MSNVEGSNRLKEELKAERSIGFMKAALEDYFNRIQGEVFLENRMIKTQRKGHFLRLLTRKELSRDARRCAIE